MGKPFLIELNASDPNVGFYMCRICQNHVALTEDFSLNYTPVTGVTGGVFDKVVNVHVNEAEQQRKLGPHTVADVYCNKCEDLLGWKFIEVYEEDPVARKDMGEAAAEERKPNRRCSGTCHKCSNNWEHQ